MANAVLERALTSKGSQTPDAELRRLPGELRRAAERLELTRMAIADTLSMPARLRQIWQLLLQLQPDELHAHRDEVRAMFDDWLGVAAMTAEVLPHAEPLAGGPLPGADQVPAARQELARFAETILTRWKSRDDLVQLMIDTIELPEWVLKGPNPPGVGFPQHWIDDVDDDPFQPLPDPS